MLKLLTPNQHESIQQQLTTNLITGNQINSNQQVIQLLIKEAYLFIELSIIDTN